MKSKNTIELNGKRYDALTGALLPDAAEPQAGPTTIDGVFRGHATAHASIPKTAASVSRQPAAPAPVRHIAVHAKAHQPETATTLMRSAVKRPKPASHKQAQGSLQHKVPSLIATKQSVYSVDQQRLARAQSTARSPHIARHAAAQAQPIPVIMAPLTVHPVPVKPETVAEPAAPAPQQTNKPFDMFEHAIANAGHFVDTQSRKYHFKKQARRHVVSMAAGTLALLVIAGFAAYQNTPGLQLKVASLKAGVATSMPNFKAAGFAYNGVKAGDGTLTLGFSGNGGNYNLVQQTTNWSGSDMIQNVGATNASGTPDYTTIQVGGTTVYRLGSNATWVANGKWYTVSGNHALTDSQVTSLVQNV